MMSWLSRINPWRRAAPSTALAGGRKVDPLPFLEVRSASNVAATNPDPQWTYTFASSGDADAALKASVWVYACAREIATAAKSIPLRVYRGADLADDHPLARLLTRPAPGWTQARWMEATAYHLTLTGRSIARKYRARSLGQSAVHRGQGLPNEIFPFPGSAYKIEYDKDDIRYPIEEYKPRRGRDKTPILPRDMVDVVYVRPGRPDLGMSPAEGSEREISTDAQASAWQQVALQNRGVPDGVFSAKMPLNADQITEAEEQLKQRWAGIRNAHLPFILGSDLEWHDLAKTAVEMELLGGRMFTKSAICAAFGVPSVLFDAAGTTYANYETARAILMTHTVLPLVRSVRDQIMADLVPEYGDPTLSVEIDLEAADALLPFLRERWNVAKTALSVGVPMSQVSETFRLGVQPYTGWDVGLVPASSVPVDSLSVGNGAGDTP
jgi:HK97 family phage portal protein